MGDNGWGSDEDKSRSETGRNHPPPPPETDGGQTRLSAILDVLSSRRRRYTLYYLQDHEVADFDALGRHLVSVEQDIPPATVSDEQYMRVKTQLLHSDLPALENAQLVEFDRRSEAIRYSDPPLLTAFLRLCAEIDTPERPTE